MSADDDHEGPPSKRQKFDLDAITEAGYTAPPSTSEQAIAGETIATSLQRPISPPPLRSKQRTPRSPTPHTPQLPLQIESHVIRSSPVSPSADENTRRRPTANQETNRRETKWVRSPFQLTRIRDLAPHQNGDTVGLKDILGDPMIKECWNFNYLFDLNYLM
jgi:tyrosyl-DNA phosphodiesterase-1